MTIQEENMDEGNAVLLNLKIEEARLKNEILRGILAAQDTLMKHNSSMLQGARDVYMLGKVL